MKLTFSLAVLSTSLLAAACGAGPTAPTSQPVVAATPAATGTLRAEACAVPTILKVSASSAGPTLTIVIDAKEPVFVELERLKGTAWVAWPIPGQPIHIIQNINVDVWFDTTYRVRTRHASCATWSDYTSLKVGPANACGGCTDEPAPVPPAQPVPPIPLVEPFFASACTDTIFVGSVTQHLPIVVPAGAYRVAVETKDAAHALGYQTEQDQEVVTLRGIGTTEDIPEAAQSHVTTFDVTVPALVEVVIDGGRDSVHGLCVSFSR